VSEAELLRIDDIELSETGGVGDLEIQLSGLAIRISWHEDWDNSASRDTIEVSLADGSYRHEYY
jgi:hypothetical protein